VKDVTLVVPGPLATRTGGSIYDRRVADGLRARGWTVSIIELDAFVHPLAPPLQTAPAQFATIPDGSVVLVDGLAFGTMPEIVEHEAWRLRFVPIVHMVLAATPGLTRGEAAWLSNLERRALARAQHIVVTGARTKTVVSVMIDRFEDQVTRIPPGVDRVLTSDEPRPAPSALHLLCVAYLTWGKGHDILLRSLAALPVAEWTLTCVGSAERDPLYADRIKTMASALGLAPRITWAGELATLETEMKRADLFVLPTRGETYGMAVAEAIAHGVPVVSTRTGEIVSIAGDGGLIAEPGDAGAFASVLREAVGDPSVRSRLAQGARAAAARLPTWNDAADAIERVLNTVVSRG
jgi:glycosyltransferase involved in cell wall biosynthesis